MRNRQVLSLMAVGIFLGIFSACSQNDQTETPSSSKESAASKETMESMDMSMSHNHNEEEPTDMQDAVNPKFPVGALR